MRIPGKRFPAKILLFGEYSVLSGSGAFAFPLERFGGQLKFMDAPDSPTQMAAASHAGIQKLIDYLGEPDHSGLADEILEMKRLRRDLAHGLFFDADIPRNYGTGSSGALVAAIYGAYGRKIDEEEFSLLRTRLGFLESAYHSRSSGMDPLVSYLDRAVCLLENRVQVTDLTLAELSAQWNIELLDSGIPGTTKSGVSDFINRFSQRPDSIKMADSELIPLVNQLVRTLLVDRTMPPMSELLRLSELQLHLFPDLFTPPMKQEALRGLDSGSFAVKLCGSGGGGFFLKIAERR